MPVTPRETLERPPANSSPAASTPLSATPLQMPAVLLLAAAAASLGVIVAFSPQSTPGRRMLNWFDAKALGVRRIVDVQDVDPADLLTPADVHNRGWSVELMIEVLGPPDYAIVDPIGRGPPLVFVSRRRVEALESDEALQQELLQLDDLTELTLRKWVKLREGYVTYAEAPLYGSEPRR